MEGKFPFVLSTDGMHVKESLVEIASLSQFMAENFYQHILHMCGWINEQTVIMTVRLYSCMICGSPLPSPPWDQDMDWYPGLGLGLAQ